jgi:hypothetical protein
MRTLSKISYSKSNGPPASGSSVSSILSQRSEKWRSGADASLRLVSSLGFNPTVPLNTTIPAPQQQELVFAQQPFQATPTFGQTVDTPSTDFFPSLAGAAEQIVQSVGMGLGGANGFDVAAGEMQGFDRPFSPGTDWYGQFGT